MYSSIRSFLRFMTSHIEGKMSSVDPTFNVKFFMKEVLETNRNTLRIFLHSTYEVKIITFSKTYENEAVFLLSSKISINKFLETIIFEPGCPSTKF